MSKRLIIFLQVATVFALLLSACAPAATQTIAPEQTVAPVQVEPTTPAEAPTAPPAVQPTTPPEPPSTTAKVKVAMIIPGSIDDQSWNTGGYNALMKLKDDLGLEVAYTERVGVANVEQALRDYAGQGYSMIIGHSFNYGDAIKKVAADFPDVNFIWSQGFPPMPDNVAAYNAPLEQSAYLAGMIGGLMTKTNKLGYIGGAQTPPMVAALGGYMAGAKLVNPNSEVIYTFPGVWDDVEKGKESAKAQFAAGADFMMGRGDGIAEGALEASKEAKVFCVGDVIDQNALAPDLLVTSTVWDLSAVFKKMLADMAAGSFKGGMYNMGMKEGATDIAPFHGLVPDDIAAKVMSVRQQIIDGTFVVPVFTEVPTAEQLDAAAKPALP